jgi:predicted neutral ceramidase superfamily lipid hydrolase
MEDLTEASMVSEPRMPGTLSRRTFSERLFAALKLESALYEEVEHDPQALAQAAGVVALAGLASALAGLGVLGPVALLSGLLSAFVAWVVWSTVVWVVGVKLFDHTTDYEELLRTLGFVAAPQLLYVLAILPFTVWQALVGLVVLVMTGIGFVRATRQALDVETGRALVVAALGLLLYLAIAAVFGALTHLA